MTITRKIVILTAASALLLAGMATAQQTYHEDFSTETFRHSSTTADWNTAQGKLKFYPFTASVIGTCDPAGACRGVAISGNHAYIASGNSGLQVVDITNMESPSWVGTRNTSGYSYEVDVSGDYAFVADWNSGLAVMDISTPASPQLVATLATGGSSLGIKIAGNHAYLGNGSGLVIVDVSDPLNPVQVGSLLTPGSAARGLSIAGQYVYLADGEAGLQIIDIGNPASPVLLATFNTPGYAYDVSTAGSHAFVSDQNNGLVVLDISDPSNPSEVGQLPVSGTLRSLCYADQRVYLASDADGVTIIDVSDPEMPSLAETLNTDGHAYDVAVDAGHAFVADLGSGFAVAAHNQEIPVELTRTLNIGNNGYSLATSENHLFMTGGNSGVSIFDISTPSHPTPAGSFGTTLSNLMVSGTYLYGFSSTTMNVVDISTPSSPIFITSLPGLPYNSKGVIWGTNIIVLANGSLNVIDISDPSQPTMRGSLNIGPDLRDLCVSGNYVYIAHQEPDIIIVDISDPDNPLVAATPSTETSLSLAISGDILYLGSYDRLTALDISDPFSPAVLGEMITNNRIQEIHISGDRVSILGEYLGLEFIDVSDPSAPVSYFQTTFGAYRWKSLSVFGEYTYVTRNPEHNIPLDKELKVYQTSQHSVDMNNNVGISGNVDQDDRTILQVGFDDLYVGNKIQNFELSADGGSHWHSVQPYRSFLQFSYPGTNLRWRLTFAYSPDINEIDHIDLNWFGPSGPLVSISDVADDQGGRVIVDVKRSAHDHSDESSIPVTQYGVYRRLADSNKADSIDVSGGRMNGKPKEVASLFPHLNSAWIDGQFYVAGSPDKSGFPSGTWVLVSTIPALQANHYFAEVTTVADSNSTGTNSSDFLVTTHTTTPGTWFISNIMSGYSVDNIAPGVPTALMANYHSEGVELNWDDSSDTDFQFYRIYRDMQPGFVPGTDNLVAETGASSWNDPEIGPWGFHYQVSAVDHAGNESLTTQTEMVSDIPGPGNQAIFALKNAVPNPFNPMTSIEYTLPERSSVVLKIYDVSGREIRTLVSDVQAPGRHTVQWKGLDNQGGSVASGVYLYRLRAAGKEQWRRMTLLK